MSTDQSASNGSGRGGGGGGGGGGGSGGDASKALQVLRHLLPYLNLVDDATSIENSKTLAELHDQTPLLVSRNKAESNTTTASTADRPSASAAVFTDDNVSLLNSRFYFVRERFVDADTVAAAKLDADRLFENGALRPAKMEDVSCFPILFNKDEKEQTFIQNLFLSRSLSSHSRRTASGVSRTFAATRCCG
jgi:hypothetical protein